MAREYLPDPRRLQTCATRPARGRPRLGLWWAVAGSLGGLPAQAEPGFDAFEVDQAFFVPELSHAWTLTLALEGRFNGLAGQTESRWPTRGLRVDGGWLHYFSGHGELAAGPYVGFGQSLAERLEPDASADAPPSFTYLTGGVLGRLRLVNPRFFTVSFGVFAEVGPFFAQGLPPTEFEPDPRDVTGWRFATGAELLGVGALWTLSPWVFVELVPWLGVEHIEVDGVAPTTSLGGGLRMRLDWARH